MINSQWFPKHFNSSKNEQALSQGNPFQEAADKLAQSSRLLIKKFSVHSAETPLKWRMAEIVKSDLQWLFSEAKTVASPKRLFQKVKNAPPTQAAMRTRLGRTVLATPSYAFQLSSDYIPEKVKNSKAVQLAAQIPFGSIGRFALATPPFLLTPVARISKHLFQEGVQLTSSSPSKQSELPQQIHWKKFDSPSSSTPISSTQLAAAGQTVQAYSNRSVMGHGAPSQADELEKKQERWDILKNEWTLSSSLAHQARELLLWSRSLNREKCDTATLAAQVSSIASTLQTFHRRIGSLFKDRFFRSTLLWKDYPPCSELQFQALSSIESYQREALKVENLLLLLNDLAEKWGMDKERLPTSKRHSHSNPQTPTKRAQALAPDSGYIQKMTSLLETFLPEGKEDLEVAYRFATRRTNKNPLKQLIKKLKDNASTLPEEVHAQIEKYEKTRLLLQLEINARELEYLEELSVNNPTLGKSSSFQELYDKLYDEASTTLKKGNSHHAYLEFSYLKSILAINSDHLFLRTVDFSFGKWLRSWFGTSFQEKITSQQHFIEERKLEVKSLEEEILQISQQNSGIPSEQVFRDIQVEEKEKQIEEKQKQIEYAQLILRQNILDKGTDVIKAMNRDKQNLQAKIAEKEALQKKYQTLRTLVRKMLQADEEKTSPPQITTEERKLYQEFYQQKNEYEGYPKLMLHYQEMAKQTTKELDHLHQAETILARKRKFLATLLQQLLDEYNTTLLDSSKAASISLKDWLKNECKHYLSRYTIFGHDFERLRSFSDLSLELTFALDGLDVLGELKSWFHELDQKMRDTKGDETKIKNLATTELQNFLSWAEQNPATSASLLQNLAGSVSALRDSDYLNQWLSMIRGNVLGQIFFMGLQSPYHESKPRKEDYRYIALVKVCQELPFITSWGRGSYNALWPNFSILGELLKVSFRTTQIDIIQRLTTSFHHQNKKSALFLFRLIVNILRGDMYIDALVEQANLDLHSTKAFAAKAVLNPKNVVNGFFPSIQHWWEVMKVASWDERAIRGLPAVFVGAGIGGFISAFLGKLKWSKFITLLVHGTTLAITAYREFSKYLNSYYTDTPNRVLRQKAEQEYRKGEEDYKEYIHSQTKHILERKETFLISFPLKTNNVPKQPYQTVIAKVRSRFADKSYQSLEDLRSDLRRFLTKEGEDTLYQLILEEDSDKDIVEALYNKITDELFKPGEIDNKTYTSDLFHWIEKSWKELVIHHYLQHGSTQGIVESIKKETEELKRHRYDPDFLMKQAGTDEGELRAHGVDKNWLAQMAVLISGNSWLSSYLIGKGNRFVHATADDVLVPSLNDRKPPAS